MTTRRDQLHSYQFVLQRVVSALVLQETDPARSPFRRVAGAVFAGLMVALLALGAVGVYGLVVPGGATSWRDGRAVVVEKESGARYVYHQGRLHPVANFASALLVIGQPGARTVSVSRNSIAGVPRGVPLGIVGAPDSLPPRGRLLSGAWTLCSVQVADTTGTARSRSVLHVGGRPPGGHDAEALLVRVDGDILLVWRGGRFTVREPAVTLAALGWASERPLPVAAAFVNALPAGPDLGRIAVPGRGRPSGKVRDARIGQVFVVETQAGERAYHTALADGLASVTQLQADLLLGDPETAALIGQKEATRLSQGDFALAPRVADLVTAGLPPRTPRLSHPAGDLAVCVASSPAVSGLRVDVPPPPADDVPRTSSEPRVLADRVVVEPGRGALVAGESAPSAPNPSVAVVTDLGIRYAVPSDQVLAVLGYAGVTPVRLPAGVVALLPAGPALDPVAARYPQGTDPVVHR